MFDLVGIHWAALDRMWFLPIIIVVIGALIWNWYRLKNALKTLVHPSHRKTILPHYSPLKNFTKVLLLCVGLISLFLALLQPQWGKKEQVVLQEGRDLVIILDISRSMCAKDIKPSRLEFAKLKIRHLLTMLPTERVALIIFSGSAYVQCPLTADHAAFTMFLNHVDTESISSGTTALDKALTKSIELFSTSQERINKLALVITDGEDFSTNLSSVQKRALQEGIHLFALGAGTPEGAPVPKFDEYGKQIGHETDATGSIVLTKLNEEQLKTICSELHGHYQRMTYDDGDIEVLVKKIQHYEKETFSDRKMSLYEDQYPWLLTLTWICFALEWIL